MPIEKEFRDLFDKIIGVMKEEYYQAYDMEDVIIVWEMLLMTFKDTMAMIFIFDEPKEDVIEKYMKKVEIIKTGFKSKEKAHV